jgi:hypothetical protein
VQVRIANSFHVNALPRARSECGAQIVRRFLTTLTAEDTSCATRVPPVRLVPRFVLKARDLDPAVPLAGNEASPSELRVVAAAVLAAEDLAARVDVNASGYGRGLRGGTFRVRRTGDAVNIEMQEVRWTRDAAVSGVLSKPQGRHAAVRAVLRVSSAADRGGRLRVEWHEGIDGGKAHVTGTFGDRKVVAELGEH